MILCCYIRSANLQSNKIQLYKHHRIAIDLLLLFGYMVIGLIRRQLNIRFYSSISLNQNLFSMFPNLLFCGLDCSSCTMRDPSLGQQSNGPVAVAALTGRLR